MRAGGATEGNSQRHRWEGGRALIVAGGGAGGGCTIACPAAAPWLNNARD